MTSVVTSFVAAARSGRLERLVAYPARVRTVARMRPQVLAQVLVAAETLVTLAASVHFVTGIKHDEVVVDQGFRL